ncbi:MAG: chemotaxis protein CheR, partial [Zoogloea sp.]|nr:chemotaxis protein CheR [Zoogloea sp.]
MEQLLADRRDSLVLDCLVHHLTVGETYFFRDPQAFAALRTLFLPQLAMQRRSSGRRLRIWSAGCCTGEEPYSIAMFLAENLHDLDRWDVSLLATDLNRRFLALAREGVYGE